MSRPDQVESAPAGIALRSIASHDTASSDHAARASPSIPLTNPHSGKRSFTFSTRTRRGESPASRLRSGGDGGVRCYNDRTAANQARSLSLTAIDARPETLLETAAKQEPAYADFLLHVMSTESRRRRQRYLKRGSNWRTRVHKDLRSVRLCLSRRSTNVRSASCARCVSCMRHPNVILSRTAWCRQKTHLPWLCRNGDSIRPGGLLMTAHDLVTDLDGLTARKARRRLRIYLAPKVLIMMKWGTCPWITRSDDLLSTRQRRYERAALF